MTNSLIQQLGTLPTYQALKNSLLKKLNADNAYVQCFMPDSEQGERDEDGRLHRFTVSENKREEQAIEELLEDDKGDFEDFIFEENRSFVREFMRSVIQEMRRCGEC